MIILIPRTDCFWNVRFTVLVSHPKTTCPLPWWWSRREWMRAKKPIAPPSERNWPFSSLMPTAGNVPPSLVAEARAHFYQGDERGTAELPGFCLAFPGLHYATQWPQVNPLPKPSQLLESEWPHMRAQSKLTSSLANGASSPSLSTFKDDSLYPD